MLKQYLDFTWLPIREEIKDCGWQYQQTCNLGPSALLIRDHNYLSAAEADSSKKLIPSDFL